MDVLNPCIVWVDGRNYRFYESFLYSQEKELGAYEEEDYEVTCDNNDEEKYEDITLTQLPSGKLWHSLDVPKDFYPFIIGKKGSTKARIESETKTTISVPRMGQKGEIVITGANRKNIISAKNRLEMIIESSRRKIEFTHFISIPMNTDSVMEKFNELKHEILTRTAKGQRNICEEVFQKPEKLHLTICPMVLLDSRERDEARKVLHECKKDVIDPIINEYGPITIQLKGLEIMNDDPSEVGVLYGDVVEETGVFQKLVNGIRDYFYDAGILTKKEGNNVKLHMTLMNGKFLLKSENSNRNRRETYFNAKSIMEAHREYSFGEIRITSIHLSQRRAYGEDGYYQPTEVISLFESE